MVVPEPELKPYVAAGETVPETTLQALALGLILSVVMVGANIYLGLYAGMTVSASVPAAVVSMGILRGLLRRGTVLENNIAQTMASAGESLAAGAIFTVPALVIVGAWQEFRFWPTTLIALLGGVIGVAFMVPLRRALIVDRPDLTYPEGVACSQVLIAGQEGGAGLRTIGLGVLIGGVLKFLVSGVHAVQGTVEAAFAAGRSVFYGGADMSAALLAVGYIVRLRIASLVFLGGFLAWVVGIPLLGGYDGDDSAIEAAWGLWSSQVRYLGVGAMLVGGIHSIWSVRRGIVQGLAGLRGVRGDRRPEGSSRTERDLPLSFLLPVLAAACATTTGLYAFLVGSLGAALVAAVVMIVAAFLFVAVATYIVGLVGSSNSPISGMTICTVLIAAGVLLLLGVRGDSAVLATLGVAGVVCCAAATAGDVAQDLKTGHLVGATPVRQQWTQLVAVIVPAFAIAPVLSLLHRAYGIGTGEPGSLLAPQAALFASLAEGFFGDGELPWTMILLGAGIGVVLIVLNALLEAFGYRFRAHVMPVAVGMYLPLSLAAPMVVGGLVQWCFARASDGGGQGRDRGVLFGSGLIAGEALMGIGLALPIVLGVSMWDLGGGRAVSLTLFAAVVAVYVGLARQKG